MNKQPNPVTHNRVGLKYGIELKCVVPELANPETLASLVPFMEAGLRESQGEATIQSLIDDILHGRQVMWVVTKYDTPIGVICTAVIQWPQYKALRITLIGGFGAEEWWPVMYIIENYAKEAGCSFIDGQGRKGLEKYTSRLGWKEVYRVFGKSLTDRAN